MDAVARRYVVTGCAGFIGSHLTESLLEDGAEVIGIDCFNDNYARADKLRNLERARDWDGFEFVPIDLARGDLDDLVADCDTVFHLAAEPGVRSSWGSRFETYVRNNVQSTQQLLECMKKWPEKRFIYSSSSSVYGQTDMLPTREDALPRPHSPYGVTKLSAEQLCLLYHGNYGSRTVALRYFTVYGPRQRPDMAFRRFIEAALDGAPIMVYGDGNQTRDFTFVDDVVDANRRAADIDGTEGRVYNVGGGSRASVNHAVALLEELTQAPIEVVHMPCERGDVRDTYADTTRARAELGFIPRVALEDGLASQLDWVRDHLHRENATAVR